jgi:hypothetical protein
MAETTKSFEDRWLKIRFQVTASNLKSCRDHLGYVYDLREMDARKEVIELCREIVRMADE